MTLHWEMTIKKIITRRSLEILPFSHKTFWMLEIFVQDLFLYSLYTHLLYKFILKIVSMLTSSSMAVDLLVQQKFSVPNMHSMFIISTTKWTIVLHLPLKWRLSSDKVFNRHHIHGQRHKNVLLFCDSRVSHLRNSQMKNTGTVFVPLSTNGIHSARLCCWTLLHSSFDSNSHNIQWKLF